MSLAGSGTEYTGVDTNIRHSVAVELEDVPTSLETDGWEWIVGADSILVG